MLIKWIQGGCKIPRWLHYSAILVEAIAIILCIILYSMDHHIYYRLLLLPVPLVYLIWLWAFGPEFGVNPPSEHK